MQDADSQPAANDASSLPDELRACHALILEQARALVAAQESRGQLSQEVEELKAYVSRLLHQLYGRRRERSTFDAQQGLLDFSDDPAAADALAEAAAEAEKILQEYTVRREVQKQRAAPRRERFPEHFPRVEETVEPPAEQRECPAHGPKQLIGYDTVETLEFERPKLWVRVRKYAKYVCPSKPACGVAQAERPTGLVEGSRYGTSVAAETGSSSSRRIGSNLAGSAMTSAPASVLCARPLTSRRVVRFQPSALAQPRCYHSGNLASKTARAKFIGRV